MVNIIDLIFIVIAIVIVVLSARKGFVASCLDAFSVVISGFVSFKFFEPVAQWVYNLIVKDFMRTALVRAIEDTSKSASPAEKLNVMLAELPEGAVKLAQGMGINVNTLVSKINQSLASNEDVFIDTFSNEVVYPVMIFVTEIVVFIVLMIVSCLLIRAISNFFSDKLKKVPVIGSADTLLGGALGVIKCAVILVIITTVFYIILATAEADSPLIVIRDSKVYNFLAEYNPVISLIK